MSRYSFLGLFRRPATAGGDEEWSMVASGGVGRSPGQRRRKNEAAAAAEASGSTQQQWNRVHRILGLLVAVRRDSGKLRHWRKSGHVRGSSRRVFGELGAVVVQKQKTKRKTQEGEEEMRKRRMEKESEAVVSSMEGDEEDERGMGQEKVSLKVVAEMKREGGGKKK